MLRHKQRSISSFLSNTLRFYAAISTPTNKRQLINPGKISNVQHIIAVASGKGGVGKSSTTVNIAAALSRMGLRVGILDADVYGPSIPKLLDMRGKPQVDGDTGLMIPPSHYGIRAMSMGLLMEEDAAAVWRGPMVGSALETFIKKVDWGHLDVLVIDMPPGTGDVQITLSQRLALNGAVIVTTPQDLALIDARRGATMFRTVKVPIMGIVENMSWFECGKCGEKAHIFGSGGADKTARDMDLEVLGHIPLHIAIRETSDEGTPIVSSERFKGSEVVKAYESVAEKIWKKLQRLDEEGEGAGAGPPKIVTL